MVAQRHMRRHARVAVAFAAVGAVLVTAAGCTGDGAAASDGAVRAAAGTGASGAGGPAAAAAIGPDGGHGPGAHTGPAGATGAGAGDAGEGAEDGKGGGSPGAVVRGAADVLARSGTSQARTSMVMASGGTRVSVDGEGAFDYGRQSGRLVVLLPPGASGAPPGDRRPVTEVVVPGALYMKNRGAGVPADKWVRLDTTAMADGNLVTGGATDPVSAAELLRGARHVSRAGWAVVGGDSVRHYRGTLDLAAAARAAAPRWRAQLAAAAKGFSRRTVPFDAYIDEEGRLRKIRHEFTFVGADGDADGDTDGAGAEGGEGGRGARGGDGGVAVSSTTWLYGFGAPVTVGLPGSADIYTGRIAPF